MRFNRSHQATALKALIAVFLFSELPLRAVGAMDFPLYDADDGIGYVPRPNQSGKFLRTHSWVFNDRSMGTAATWDPGGRPSALLIVNSVVMGGNPVDQTEKLGPLLQRTWVLRSPSGRSRRAAGPT